MLTSDLLIYAAHFLFWAAFGVTRLITARNNAPPAPSAASAPHGQPAEVASWSRTVLSVHLLAFGVMYFGLGAAVFPNRVPAWFPGQRVVGVFLIGLGAFVASWAVASFQSWRFRAKLEHGHQLATNGAFRLLRHPIYMGLNLLAVGTAFWVPAVTVWVGAALMVVGSELRARVEERVLAKVFGSAYGEYCARTRRFIPGVY